MDKKEFPLDCPMNEPLVIMTSQLPTCVRSLQWTPVPSARLHQEKGHWYYSITDSFPLRVAEVSQCMQSYRDAARGTGLSEQILPWTKLCSGWYGNHIFLYRFDCCHQTRSGSKGVGEAQRCWCVAWGIHSTARRLVSVVTGLWWIAIAMLDRSIPHASSTNKHCFPPEVDLE